MDDLDRRRMLLAAAGTSLLPLLEISPATGQETTGQKVPTNILAPTARSSESQIKDYRALTEHLSKWGAWNPVFNTSYEEGIVDQLNNVLAEERKKPTHNPRLVEPLLGEIASLLERCLAYRREAADLEIQGVASGIARAQSEALRELDRRLLMTTPTKEVADIIASRYAEAAKLFRQSNAPSANANAVEALAQSLGNIRISEKEGQRLELTYARLLFSQGLEQQALGRHEVSGNAHNFAERFERTRKLFDSDLTSAYRRAIAAARGLSKIFGYTDLKAIDWHGSDFLYQPSIPNPAKPNFLDEFVMWTRNAMRAVAHIGENEMEITKNIAISLSGQTDHLDIDLRTRPYYFVGLKHVRLRAIGASFTASSEDLKDPDKSGASFGLVLAKDDGDGIGRNDVYIIPYVRAYLPQRSVDFVDGSNIFNLDPRGAWSFRLSQRGLSGSHVSIERMPLVNGKPVSWVTGLVLHFRVVCTLDPSFNANHWLMEDRV